MSSTNKTVTIELSQYIATDKPTYLVDYNGDMLKIDTAIANDRVSIATAQGTADGADAKADANAEAIQTLDNEVNNETTGLAGKVNDVIGDVNTIESLIGNGEPTTSDKTIIGAINEIDGDVGDIDTKIGSGTPTTTAQSIIGAINELDAGKADASDLANIHIGEVLKYTADTSATDRAHQIANIYSAYSNLSNSEKIHSYIKRGSYVYRCTSHGNTGMYVTEIEDNGDIRTEMIVLTNDAATSKLLRYVVNTSNNVTFTDGSSESASSDLELYITHVTT